MNIDAYPKRALFEGIINAIVYRDNYIDGTQIQIDMFKDRLEISSPGNFYKEEKFGKIYNLSEYVFKRKNKLISSVLKACNIETGFDNITKMQHKFISQTYI